MLRNMIFMMLFCLSYFIRLLSEISPQVLKYPLNLKSDFETACLETPSCLAISAWVDPAAYNFRIFILLSESLACEKS